MTGTVVAFPSGESLSPAGPDSVAGIAEVLHRKLERRRSPPRPRSHLAVRLDTLVGVADQTIRRLEALAAGRLITPETAIRLALRHAREIGTARPPRIRGVPGVYDVHLSGDGLRSFAVRIASTDGGPWIGSARVGSFDRLLRVCPSDCRAICLLVGRVEAAKTTVRMTTTPSWQVTMIGRSMRPGWRSLSHLLVVGGLPSDTRDRSDATAAIARLLRTRPHLTFLFKESVRPLAPRSEAADQIIRLLAIALPGLLRPDHGGDQP
ncbi:hypothetical protein HCU64_23340 [Methylobacterium sp. C25]|uniref:hypothetical protein n=1 Tax=Methylobacterium sp. C25 TaxID=2721622 RepID=UPI001F2FCD6A|nr:hypothetical protein [Methylobacterium sp. C25]MCE4226681.1 hypothetical protein [Methylobacterium sp. C25]